MDQLRKAARLPFRESCLLGEAWLCCLVARFALRLFSFGRLLTVIQRTAERHRPHLDAGGVARLARLVEIAARHAPGTASCLEGALVLGWLLGRRGIVTTVNLGVARRNGEVLAHAWLERDGQILIGGRTEEIYSPIFSAPSATRPA